MASCAGDKPLPKAGAFMRLGWDEIRRRAKAFSEEWKDARYEKGETQTFYNKFFEILGKGRCRMHGGTNPGA